MTLRTTATVLAAVVVLDAVGLRAGTESRQAADALSRKIAAITQRAEQRDRRAETVTLTEEELNSWFLYRSARYLPVGVSKPAVALLGQGSVKAMATIDLESLGRRRSGGSALNPLSYLGGRVPVAVTGNLVTKDGMGRFDVQSSDVAGIPVPASILQELVSYFATTPEQPAGIRLDESFALPANIQRIDVGRGQMLVVQ